MIVIYLHGTVQILHTILEQKKSTTVLKDEFNLITM